MKTAHSKEAEQAVLGSLLLDQKAIHRLQGLAAADFYIGNHRLIFEAIVSLYRRKEDGDVITVSEALSKSGKLDQVGGLAYLAELAQNTPSAVNAGGYAKVVRERSQLRQAAAVLENAKDHLRQEGLTAVTQAVSDLMRLLRTHGPAVTTLQSAAFQVLEDITAIQQHGRRPGLPTGLSELDQKIGGLHNSDLIVIGGRPGMGKTSILFNLAWHSQVPAGIITAEQPSIQLAQRALAMLGKINGKKFRNASLTPDEFTAAYEAYTLMSERPIYLFDRPRPSMDDVLQQARQWQHEHGIQFLGVDYIQRLKASSGDSREEQIEQIVMDLKSIAKELNIPVVALSSVNRSLENREDKRPTLSDFRGSGAIESEADVAIGLYREEFYKQTNSNHGMAEMIFLKNRHGPTGYIDVRWREEFMVFEDA